MGLRQVPQQTAMSNAHEKKAKSHTLLDSIERLANIKFPAANPFSLHPYATDVIQSVAELNGVVAAAAQLAMSLSTYEDVPFGDGKIVMALREQCALAHSVSTVRTIFLVHPIARKTDWHVMQVSNSMGVMAESLKANALKRYGDDVPISSCGLAGWLVTRLKSWASMAGMEAFDEESCDGNINVALAGKVMVVDIILHAEIGDGKLSVKSLKLTFASAPEPSSPAKPHSLADERTLDDFLLECLNDYVTEIQKGSDSVLPNSVRAAECADAFRDHLVYLMKLDSLSAYDAGKAGLSWFREMNIVTQIAMGLRDEEAQAVASSVSA